MKPNAAGLIVSGEANPNWKGGKVAKQCACGASFSVSPGRSAAKFCSMKCVGISQRGRSSRKSPPKISTLVCAECGSPFKVPECHAPKYRCCSAACKHKQHGKRTSGAGNANWRGGLSRLPYPWNFRFISRAIIQRDGARCLNPTCTGADRRLTAHHIDYDKSNCDQGNLITLCSSCNSRANFNRRHWQQFYGAITRPKKDGGGWEVENF